ncbi:MAG: hypothetical protein NTW29_11945 [Bacteroidetes bacterium]|nr:hypothetical protein [Bacteroidota bacterium]
MELVTIFVNEHAEGLYAVRYNSGEKDEFERLFDEWDDTSFVMSYFLLNKQYLKHPFFDNYSLESLVSKVHRESTEIREMALHTNGNSIIRLFRPLETKQKVFSLQTHLQRAKASIKEPALFPRPLLRLYGLRMDDTTFIITGGAIKITRQMDEHPDTKAALGKMELVRNWLESTGNTTFDDLKYCYGES